MQPCISRAWEHHSTNAPAEQHAKSVGGRRGKSQKAASDQTFGLCTKHHDNFHDARGFCESWDKAQRRLWQDALVALTTERYQAYLDSLPTGVLELDEAPVRAPTPSLKQVAEQFAAERQLGSQVAFDLNRLLEQLEREGVF